MEREPQCCRFSGDPGGRLLAVMFERGTPALEVWDWRTGASVWRGEAAAAPMAFDLAADGRTLALATRAGLRVVDTGAGAAPRTAPLAGEPAAG